MSLRMLLAIWASIWERVVGPHTTRPTSQRSSTMTNHGMQVCRPHLSQEMQVITLQLMMTAILAQTPRAMYSLTTTTMTMRIQRRSIGNTVLPSGVGESTCESLFGRLADSPSEAVSRARAKAKPEAWKSEPILPLEKDRPVEKANRLARVSLDERRTLEDAMERS